MRGKNTVVPVVALVAIVVVAGLALGLNLRWSPQPERHAAGFARKERPHFDHAAVIPAGFDSPQAVTRSCLGCHPKASEVMKTSHWLWLGDEVEVPAPVPPQRRPGVTRIGKKNLINNFCISTTGNERGCTKCHIGYGWADASFDFTVVDNIDCLVCHEQTGAYVKGPAGLPTAETDLVAAARSVGTPTRENCLTCHAYGGGGQAVKHGDIDSSLAHPVEDEDVHMGRHDLLCVDCHRAPDHRIQGRAFSVSVEGSQGVACVDCHTEPEHEDERIEAHLTSVTCQTCHIPTFARTIPTKATWDWSRAGDATREEDPHRYLKMKGEFTYEQDVVPQYRWFDGRVARYLLGDRIDPTRTTTLNPPLASIADSGARIWPFKVHLARQPYDAGYDYLFTPVTAGAGGFWTTFDWDSAFRLGAKASGLPYSGRYGFAPTEMLWRLTHQVAPKEKALTCTDCHGEGGRMDWRALGYAGDPLEGGGRP
jgi:octaheme c-type cytochrome (tetrathionate reductase family)